MNNHTHPSSSYARILFRHLRLSEENCDAYFQGTNVSYQEMMTLDGTIPREDFDLCGPLLRVTPRQVGIAHNLDSLH